MNQETIALVFMADSNESFFIENPPKGPPEKWIERFVNDITQVEYVKVETLTLAPLHAWSNPNVCPES